MRVSTASIVLTTAIVTTTTTTTKAFVVPSASLHNAVASTTASSSSSSSSSSTKLNFGIPDMFLPKDDENSQKGSDSNNSGSSNDKNNKISKEKKIGLAGIVQLITAGAGAPFLGEFQGVDKETGKFMFSLEANNLVDENGNSKQTQMPFFEQGWVDPADEARAKEGFKLFPWQK